MLQGYDTRLRRGGKIMGRSDDVGTKKGCWAVDGKLGGALIVASTMDVASNLVLRAVQRDASSGNAEKSSYAFQNSTTDVWLLCLVRTALLGILSGAVAFKPSATATRAKSFFTNFATLGVTCLGGKALAWTLSPRTGVNASSDDMKLYFWVALSCGVAFSILEMMIFSRLCGKASDFARQSKASELANKLLGSESSGKSTTLRHRKRDLKSLHSLRFFAAMHIIVYHFLRDPDDAPEKDHVFSDTWNRFAGWGGAQLSLFYLLSGFVLAYQYSDRSIQNPVRFWAKRFARLYPMYAVTIILMLAQIPSSEYTAREVVVVSLCLQSWIAPQHDGIENSLNTPGWTVGTFLFLYAIFPFCAKMLKNASNATLRFCACVLYAFSALGAADAMGYVIGGVYSPLFKCVFAAHTQTFLLGACLGILFCRSQATVEMTSVASQIGATVFLASLLAIFLLVDIDSESFWSAWSVNGMLSPLLAIVIWYLARGKDAVLSYFLEADSLVYLGKISFCMYVMQTSVEEYVVDYYCMQDHDTPCASVFITTLIVSAAVAWHVVEGPVGSLVMRAYDCCFSNVRDASLDQKNRTVLKLYSSWSLRCAANILAYYAFAALIVGGYIALATLNVEWAQWTDIFVLPASATVADIALSAVKWLAVLALPGLLFCTVGHLVWCPFAPVAAPSIEETIRSGAFSGNKLHWRIVTRGKWQDLVTENVEAAASVLEACLPREYWVVEVVTDNYIGLVDRTCAPVTEIVVPESYRCPNGARYKARALNYAIAHSEASPLDWIIHLDEETRFDETTVATVLAHCAAQNEMCARGEKSHGDIGQGVIVYGTERVGPIQNYLTTLADNIRVADDFGKFRFQYEFHEPWIGMHGSFVVCQNKVEMDVGFDHGLAGSITEDAYFALAARAIGVKFSWINSLCYEQSPFGFMDFIQQRRRWYGGLWLVCRAKEIPIRRRIVLTLMTISWALSFFVGFAILLCMIVKTNAPDSLRIVLSIVAGLSCWGYVLGFYLTFSIRDGVARYSILLFLQLLLQPVFAVMEISGVVYAIVKPPIGGFFIVQKEQGKENTNND